jgi:hypothetical protein
MKKKNYRLGIAALAGLVCYFLALSALLFSSLGMPGGNGFGAGAGKTSQSHGNSHKGGKHSPPHGKSHPHGSSVPAGGITRNENDPCLIAPATCAGGNFYQPADRRGGSSGQDLGDAIFGNGKGGAVGDHHFPNPIYSGFTYFGGGPAFGSSGGPGENGGSLPDNGQDAGGTPQGSGDHSDGTPPAFGNSDPDTPAPSNQTPISQFFPGDPPGPGNPDNSTGTPQSSSSDPPPDSDPSDPPISVPEPSTFWVFAGSMVSALTAFRLSGRAKPGQPRR